MQDIDFEQKAIKDTNIMKNKIGIVMGVANERSLAWGITKYLSENGAKVILTYQGEALKKRVVPLAEKVNSPATYECDVSDQKSLEKLFNQLKKNIKILIF